MSRGPGKLQRAVLAELSRSARRLTTLELGNRLWPDGWDRAQEVALRRAMHGLAERGLAWIGEARLWPHLQIAIGLPSHECICEREAGAFANLNAQMPGAFSPGRSAKERWLACTKCRVTIGNDPALRVRVLGLKPRFAKRCLDTHARLQATLTGAP